LKEADMQNDEGYKSHLEARYQFAAWQAPSKGVQGSSAQAPDPTSLQVPGWRLVRRSESQPQAGVAVSRSMWEGAAGSGPARGVAGRLLNLEIATCRTPAEARQYLLSLLGDMQGPVAIRDKDGVLGEVSFALGGDTALLFVRGSVAVRMRNGGREVVTLREAAKAIDDALTSGGPERRSRGA
jgi:hypothetical protein